MEENKMNEERLYKLAHKQLESEWFKFSKRADRFPNFEVYKMKEEELWNELQELEKEMDKKRIRCFE